nr:MAG TPA: hypothetical protein [Crassvirales sp.]
MQVVVIYSYRLKKYQTIINYVCVLVKIVLHLKL